MGGDLGRVSAGRGGACENGGGGIRGESERERRGVGVEGIGLEAKTRDEIGLGRGLSYKSPVGRADMVSSRPEEADIAKTSDARMTIKRSSDSEPDMRGRSASGARTTTTTTTRVCSSRLCQVDSTDATPLHSTHLARALLELLDALHEERRRELRFLLEVVDREAGRCGEAEELEGRTASAGVYGHS